MTIYEIIDAVCAECNLPRERLLSSERTARVSDVRARAAWKLLEAGVPRFKIAKALDRTERMVNIMLAKYAEKYNRKEEINRFSKSAKRRDLLAEMFREGKPLRQIAEATGYSYGSVRTIASRMRQKENLPDARRRYD